eukprot:5935162-Pyramimonas_sp.AAC.1
MFWGGARGIRPGLVGAGGAFRKHPLPPPAPAPAPVPSFAASPAPAAPAAAYPPLLLPPSHLFVLPFLVGGAFS